MADLGNLHMCPIKSARMSAHIFVGPHRDDPANYPAGERFLSPSNLQERFRSQDPRMNYTAKKQLDDD